MFGSALASPLLSPQGARLFSKSKPVSIARAAKFFAKPEPVAKVFNSVRSNELQPARRLNSARLALAREGKLDQAPAYLVSLAGQECARMTAKELTETLFAFSQAKDGSGNSKQQQLEVLREIFGRDISQFTGDELVQVLELVLDAAPDRPVQSVRASFSAELAKRSPKSFSTKSLVFLLPASVHGSKFPKLASELAKRQDFSPSELVRVLEVNAGRDFALALHVSQLLEKAGPEAVDLAALPLPSLVKFRFAALSDFSKKVWDQVGPKLGGEELGGDQAVVKSLVALLPFGSKAMDHDKVAKLVLEPFLKSHDNVALVLDSLSRVEYNSESAVWIRVRECLDKQPALFLPIAKQLEVVQSLNRFAPQHVVDAVAAKTVFANAQGDGGEMPWQQPADLSDLGTESLQQVRQLLARAKLLPHSATLLASLDEEIQSRQ